MPQEEVLAKNVQGWILAMAGMASIPPRDMFFRGFWFSEIRFLEFRGCYRNLGLS